MRSRDDPVDADRFHSRHAGETPLTSSRNSGIFHLVNKHAAWLVPVCCLAALSAPRAAGQERREPVQIEEAGVLRATGVDEVFDLAGSVRLSHGSTVLTSDRVRYDRLNGIVHLAGNVRMMRETSTFSAEAAVYYEQDQRAIGAGRVKLDDELDGVVLTGHRMVFTQDPHRAVATGKPAMTWQQDGSRINIEGFRLEYYFTESNTLLKALAVDSVVVVDEGEGVTIYCDHAEYYKTTQSAVFSGSPRMVRRLGSDEGEIEVTGNGMTYGFEDRTADVFDSVRVVKGTLEGICDTLRFDGEGLKIDLIGNPVIRSVHSEIAGDGIVLEMEDGKVAKALVTGNAKGTYAVEKTEGTDRSTIEGRSMIVDFEGEAVRTITAHGNAVSNYNPSTLESGPSGHNVVRAKEIVIELDGGEPVKVNADGGVDGTYLTPEDDDGSR